MNRKALRLTFVSTLILILSLALVSASPAWTGTGNYVGSLWQLIIWGPDALLLHAIDAGGVPRPTDLPAIIAAGYTVTTMTRIGQMLLATSNRVWPTGTPTGHPADPYYANATIFRKALFRLVNRDAILRLYGPLKSKARFWLPPCQEPWIELDPASPDYAPTPDVDRMIAVGLLDAAGFVQGSTPNPNYNGEPWSAEYWRIDPQTGEDMESVELLTINPGNDLLSYEAALNMTAQWQIAGIPIDLVASTFGAIVSRLTNTDLYDYQIIYPADIYWGATAPTNLYDLTHSLNLPLWNLVGMNRSMGSTNDAQAIASMDLDYWGEQMFKMFKTLSMNRVKRCALELQNILRDTAPYLPMFIDNGFSAFTGPHNGQNPSRGYLGIVNAKCHGALGYSRNIGLVSPIGQVWSSNVWAKTLGRADRAGNDLMIWGLNEVLDTLNPLLADTQPDWKELSLITDVLLQQNPYSHKYMAWAADPSVMDYNPAVGYTPKMKPWVGPGRDQIGGDGVYNAPVTYAYDPDTGRPEIATYNGIAVEDLTAGDMQGDDQLGMRTIWKLRDDLYWHDSDPGPDKKFGTGDDGPVYQVTTADVTFMMNEILIGQQNERYFSEWWYVNSYTALDTLKFEVYEERRYPFAFESHSDVATLGPKHIWEGDLIGPDNIWGTDDDIHHKYWRGWEVSYMENMIMKRNDMPGWQLSRLIGFGPYMYHISGPEGVGPGWQPGILTHVETNQAYFGTYTPWFPNGNPGRIVLGDVDLNQLVEMPDVSVIIDAFGSHPGDPHWDPKADITFPAQFVQLDDLNLVIAQYGYTWGPYRLYTIPPDP